MRTLTDSKHWWTRRTKDSMWADTSGSAHPRLSSLGAPKTHSSPTNRTAKPKANFSSSPTSDCMPKSWTKESRSTTKNSCQSIFCPQTDWHGWRRKVGRSVWRSRNHRNTLHCLSQTTRSLWVLLPRLNRSASLNKPTSWLTKTPLSLK